MNESDQTTIPIRGSSSDIAEEHIAPKQKRRLIGEFYRFFKVTCYTTVLVVAGWGCWHFLFPASNTDTADEIADLEGFELAPTFPLVPKRNANDAESSTSVSMGLAVPLPDDATLADSTASNETSVSLPPKSVEVWLTGTIEEAEPAPRSESSLRISGSPNDPSTIR